MKQKILKFLNLTKSNNEWEVLSAIRKANEVIENNRTSWEQILMIPKIDEDSYIYKMQLKKEQLNSIILNDDKRILYNLIKYLVIIIIILIIVILI